MLTVPCRHQFALRFDRTVCRDCGRDAADAGPECKGARKVRPLAAFRQQHDEADRPPGYDVPPGPRIDAARRRAAEFFGDRGRA